MISFSCIDENADLWIDCALGLIINNVLQEPLVSILYSDQIFQLLIGLHSDGLLNPTTLADKLIGLLLPYPFPIQQDIMLSIYSALQRIFTNVPAGDGCFISFADLLSFEFDLRSAIDAPSFSLIPFVSGRERVTSTLPSRMGNFDRPSWIDHEGNLIIFTNRQAGSSNAEFGRGTFGRVRAAQSIDPWGNVTDIAVKKFSSDEVTLNSFGGHLNFEMAIVREYRVMGHLAQRFSAVEPKFLVKFSDSKHRPYKMGMQVCDSTVNHIPFERLVWITPEDRNKVDLVARLKSDLKACIESRLPALRYFLRSIKLMHDMGVPHGDIKGGNIHYLDQFGAFVPGDFGAINSYDFLLRHLGKRKNQTFRAPEATGVLSTKKIASDRASVFGGDIWAIGVTFVSLVFQTRLVSDFHYDETIYGPEADPNNVARFLSDLPTLILRVVSDIEFVTGPIFSDFILRCLRIDSNHRATIEELIDHPLFTSGIG